MSKRELIEPHKGDKRFARRDAQGRFTEMDDVGRSLSQDRKRQAKPPPGRDRATAAIANDDSREAGLIAGLLFPSPATDVRTRARPLPR